MPGIRLVTTPIYQLIPYLEKRDELSHQFITFLGPTENENVKQLYKM